VDVGASAGAVLGSAADSACAGSAASAGADPCVCAGDVGEVLLATGGTRPATASGADPRPPISSHPVQTTSTNPASIPPAAVAQTSGGNEGHLAVAGRAGAGAGERTFAAVVKGDGLVSASNSSAGRSANPARSAKGDSSPTDVKSPRGNSSPGIANSSSEGNASSGGRSSREGG